LGGVGLGFAAVEAAAHPQSAVNDAEGGRQGSGVRQHAGQMEGVLAHGLGGFDQAAVGEGPAAREEEPMLDDHGEQLGQDLTQDAPGFGTAGGVDLAVALPQFKEQLDLPAGAGEHESLAQGEQLGRGGGDQQRPVSGGELGGAGGMAPAARSGVQATAALVGHLLRDTHGEQARGQVVGGTQTHGQFDGGRRLRGQQAQHIAAGAISGEDACGEQQTGEPVDALRRHRGKDSQVEEAQIRQPQRTGRQRGVLQGTAVLMGPSIGQQRPLQGAPDRALQAGDHIDSLLPGRPLLRHGADEVTHLSQASHRRDSASSWWSR